MEKSHTKFVKLVRVLFQAQPSARVSLLAVNGVLICQNSSSYLGYVVSHASPINN